MTDFDKLLASLPTPGIDERPPYVEMDADQKRRAAMDGKWEASLLDPKNDTEKRVKYVLENLCGMHLKKDGDYVTIPGGRLVWQKKISDYVGSTPGNERNYHTYVEVKGISPGNRFSFVRLDKSNKPGEPSQHEKLSDAWDAGNLVFLVIGWWLAPRNTKPIKIEKNNKVYTKWKKSELELEIDLIPWSRWLKFYTNTKARSLTKTQSITHFADCLITKAGREWAMASDHWWNRRYEVWSPVYGTKLIAG